MVMSAIDKNPPRSTTKAKATIGIGIQVAVVIGTMNALGLFNDRGAILVAVCAVTAYLAEWYLYGRPRYVIK